MGGRVQETPMRFPGLKSSSNGDALLELSVRRFSPHIWGEGQAANARANSVETFGRFGPHPHPSSLRREREPCRLNSTTLGRPPCPIVPQASNPTQYPGSNPHFRLVIITIGILTNCNTFPLFFPLPNRRYFRTQELPAWPRQEPAAFRKPARLNERPAIAGNIRFDRCGVRVPGNCSTA